MKLSTSLHKNIIISYAGGILSRFLAKKRRITLFFEDILGKYIVNCEKHNHKNDLRVLAEKWGWLTTQKLMPPPLKMIPPNLLLNTFVGKSWNNVGIINDVHVYKDGDVVYLTTKNESITRIIGKNDFMPGFFNGVINAVYNSQFRIINCLQTREFCGYRFELSGESVYIEGKDKALYDQLNNLEPIRGFALHNALNRKILQLRENKVYFRGKRITITENTIFHLVGNANLLLDRAPNISYDFFYDIINKDSTDEQKLVLLKNLIQIMGWGIATIIMKDKNEIIIEIKNPPYGLQSEKDNWNFLYNTTLGYLWLLNKDFVIENVKEYHKNLRILYSV